MDQSDECSTAWFNKGKYSEQLCAMQLSFDDALCRFMNLCILLPSDGCWYLMNWAAVKNRCVFIYTINEDSVLTKTVIALLSFRALWINLPSVHCAGHQNMMAVLEKKSEDHQTV